MISAEEAGCAKAAGPSPEVLYLGREVDEEEPLFLLLLYLWRNELRELGPATRAEWSFVREFLRIKRVRTERGLVWNDGIAWEILKKLATSYTYPEHAGGVRSYVTHIRRSLKVGEQSRERSTPDIDSIADDATHEWGEAYIPPDRHFGEPDHYLIRDAAECLRIKERTLYGLCQRGDLETTKVFGKLALTAGFETGPKSIEGRSITQGPYGLHGEQGLDRGRCQKVYSTPSRKRRTFGADCPSGATKEPDTLTGCTVALISNRRHPH
jgi:hypothetical protein